MLNSGGARDDVEVLVARLLDVEEPRERAGQEVHGDAPGRDALRARGHEVGHQGLLRAVEHLQAGNQKLHIAAENSFG